MIAPWNPGSARAAIVKDMLRANAIDGDDILDDAIREKHLTRAYLAGAKALSEAIKALGPIGGISYARWRKLEENRLKAVTK